MKADIKKKSWRCQIESLTIYFQVLENKNEPNPKATNGAKKDSVTLEIMKQKLKKLCKN